jgi:hypothetical protein
MKSGLRVAGAIGVGYLLGRTHKTRLALALGVAAATGQLGRAPGELMQRGTKALAGSDALGPVAEPGQRLLEASKAAAMAAFTSRLDSMSHALTDRADALRAPTLPRSGGQEAEQPKEASTEEQGKADEQDEQGEPERREAPTEERSETEEPGGEAEEQGEPKAKAETRRRAKAAVGAPVRRGAR